MNSRYPNHVYRHLAVVATAAALAFTAGTTVAAQYQWRDAKGRMVCSDLPPPTSVAPDRIIRGPSVAPGEPGQGAPAPAADDATGMVANAATKVATNPGVNSAPGAGEAGLSIADR